MLSWSCAGSPSIGHVSPIPPSLSDFCSSPTFEGSGSYRHADGDGVEPTIMPNSPPPEGTKLSSYGMWLRAGFCVDYKVISGRSTVWRSVLMRKSWRVVSEYCIAVGRAVRADVGG